MRHDSCSVLLKTGNKKRRLREMEAARRGHRAAQGTHVVRVLAAFLRRYDPVQVPGSASKKPSQPVFQQAPLAVDTAV